jgi:hypothetical protein
MRGSPRHLQSVANVPENEAARPRGTKSKALDVLSCV